MKIAELSVLFIIATSSGAVLADQQAEQSSHFRAENPTAGTVVNVDGLNKKINEEKSLKEQVSNSKSLKELDRERKGLPSYWNG